MDVEVLNHFLTVVREENISRAAERLHVTQPTLSRQMAALEEELGTQLFIRGKHLQLTDAGVLLRGRAEEVTQIIDKIRMEFKAGEELSGVVSIGTGGLMSAQILSKLTVNSARFIRLSVSIYTRTAPIISASSLTAAFWISRSFWNRWTSGSTTLSACR